MKRLFVAVVLSEEIRERIGELSDRLHTIDIDGSFVSMENIHITLKFLGDVHEENIPLMCELIEKGVTGVHTFSASIRGVGVFPSIEKIQTIWAAILGNEMKLLLQKINEMLHTVRKGHTDEIPHITLLRVKSGRNTQALRKELEKWQQTDFGVLSVDKVILYESELTFSGPIYKKIKEFRLR